MALIKPLTTPTHFLPRFIQLSLRLLTFANVKNYPGNFQTLVHAHTTVYSLMELINQRLGETTQKLTVYRNDSGETMIPLDPHHTLQDSGYQGGPKNAPQEVELMYDFTTEFKDCPILNTDHYFM